MSAALALKLHALAAVRHYRRGWSAVASPEDREGAHSDACLVHLPITLATVCAIPTPTNVSSRACASSYACARSGANIVSDFKRYVDIGGYPAASHLCDKAAFAEQFPHIIRSITGTNSTKTAKQMAKFYLGKMQDITPGNFNKRTVNEGHLCISYSSI